MKIEFKGFAHYPRMSEETMAYVASDLIINGTSYGHAKNDGHGGCDMISRSAMDALEEYAKTLPGEVHDMGNGQMFLMQPNWETVLSNAVFEEVRRQTVQKQRKKKFVKCTIKGNGEVLYYPLSSWGKLAGMLWKSPSPTHKATMKQELELNGTIDHSLVEVVLINGSEVPEDQL